MKNKLQNGKPRLKCFLCGAMAGKSRARFLRRHTNEESTHIRQQKRVKAEPS